MRSHSLSDLKEDLDSGEVLTKEPAFCTSNLGSIIDLIAK